MSVRTNRETTLLLERERNQIELKDDGSGAPVQKEKNSYLPRLQAAMQRAASVPLVAADFHRGKYGLALIMPDRSYMSDIGRHISAPARLKRKPQKNPPFLLQRFLSFGEESEEDEDPCFVDGKHENVRRKRKE